MAVTLSLFAGAGAQFFDNNGNLLSGGLIYTYVAGTTTPLATYTDNTGNTALANPIVLDSAGRVPTGEIWLTYGQGYKFVVKTSTGTLIGTYDNIPFAALPPLVNDAASISYEQGASVIAGNFIIGQTYLITSLGTTNFQSIGASANIVGIYFTATGVGSGTGTAQITRTVQAKLQEVISIKDFGAVGNGTTDDTAAIQTALNANANWVPAGTYKITSALTVPSGTTLTFASGASFTAGVNSLTFFQTTAFTSSVSITNANLNGNGFTGCTGFSFVSLQINSEINNVNLYKLDTGIKLVSGCIGIDINHPNSYQVLNPIKIGTSCNAITIIAPNLDNAIYSGGTGTGIGININASSTTLNGTTIVGGYIQGFTNGVIDTGLNMLIEGVYFEQITDGAIYLNGSYQAKVNGCFYFGFSGTSFIKGRNAYSATITYPTMVASNATVGLYDFDSSNKYCIESHTLDYVNNTVLGVVTGITPSGQTTYQRTPSVIKTITATTAVAFAPVTFNVFSPNSISLCEVTVVAQEKTGNIASITRKYVFALTNVVGTITASAVASDAASSTDKTSANYTITPTVTVSVLSATTAQLNITLTSGGAIGWINATCTVNAAIFSNQPCYIS